MTITDIARMAGVSVSSVSNYFNRPGRVGAATAARIRAAVAKTGFVPDVHRPGPKTGERIGVKTGNIAFLHPGGGLLRRFLARPGIPRLLEGIERALEARRLRSFQMNYVHQSHEGDCLDFYRSGDGEGGFVIEGIKNGAETVVAARVRFDD